MAPTSLSNHRWVGSEENGRHVRVCAQPAGEERGVAVDAGPHNRLSGSAHRRRIRTRSSADTIRVRDSGPAPEQVVNGLPRRDGGGLGSGAASEVWPGPAKRCDGTLAGIRRLTTGHIESPAAST